MTRPDQDQVPKLASPSHARNAGPGGGGAGRHESNVLRCLECSEKASSIAFFFYKPPNCTLLSHYYNMKLNKLSPSKIATLVTCPKTFIDRQFKR